jgi:hypothetical protein
LKPLCAAQDIYIGIYKYIYIHTHRPLYSQLGPIRLCECAKPSGIELWYRKIKFKTT